MKKAMMRRKYSGENVRRLVKAILYGGPRMMGVPVTITPFGTLTPKMWVNFLNADPECRHPMYSVYKGLMGYFQEFRKWAASEGYGFGPSIREMRPPLSRKDFLNKYPEMEKDAKAIHNVMTKLLDKPRNDVIIGILTGEGAAEELKSVDLSLLPFTFVVQRAGPGKNDATLDIRNADHANFWIYLAFGAMVLAWRKDKIPARRCDCCRRFYIPYQRACNQRFDLPSCKSRYYSRKSRLSRGEIV